MALKLTLQTPLDMHLHLRDEEMLKLVAPLSAKTFSGALIMPNLVPPITTKEALLAYKQRICTAVGNEHFEPYMTLFFQHYSYDFLKAIKDEIIGTNFVLECSGTKPGNSNGSPAPEKITSTQFFTAVFTMSL